jgi:hypothetical protein
MSEPIYSNAIGISDEDHERIVSELENMCQLIPYFKCCESALKELKKRENEAKRGG